MSSFDSNIKMMRKALDRSYAFVRRLYRFSLKERIKHPAKIIHRKFKLNHKNVNHNNRDKSKWETIIYWTIIIIIPLILLVVSFSFISRPDKFFSKSGGIYAPDITKFLIIPSFAFLGFMVYFVYSSLKSNKMRRSRIHKKTKYKKIKIRTKVPHISNTVYNTICRSL